MAAPKILVIDPQMAGIAGDMFVAALLDLGANAEAVIAAMEATPKYVPDCRSVIVKPTPVKRSHIGGLYLDIKIEESFTTRPGGILLDAVKQMGMDLKLSPEGVAYANRAIQHLVNAEAHVHRQSPENVHLHGAGSADTVIDIIGAATALEQLRLLDTIETESFVLPIAVGGGTFPSGHGQLAAPGPAVTDILTKAKLLFRGGPLMRELTTPTGAALIAALNPRSIETYPLLRPLSIGYGAGTAELPDVPNLLRFILGEPINRPRLYQDHVIIIETNVDDVSGETLGYIIDKVMSAGAKDVSILPTTTKKNRPGHLISVIADPEQEEALTYLLISESGSLGVRVISSDRHRLAYEYKTIDIKIGAQKVSIKVKIATDRTGSIIQIKAEYDDVKRAAEQTRRPLVEIARRAETAARHEFDQKGG